PFVLRPRAPRPPANQWYESPTASNATPRKKANTPGAIGVSCRAGKFQRTAPTARFSAIANMGTAGTRGTRKPGPLRRSRRRNAMTEAWTNAKRPRKAKLARIAIVSIVRKTRIPDPTNVRATAAGGTSRPPIRANTRGRSPSRAMLNDVRIAAVRFEFKAPHMETTPITRNASRTYGPPRQFVMLTSTMSSDPPRHALQQG